MTDALEDHTGTLKTGGKTIKNVHFVYDIDGQAGDEQELPN